MVKKICENCQLEIKKGERFETCEVVAEKGEDGVTRLRQPRIHSRPSVCVQYLRVENKRLLTALHEEQILVSELREVASRHIPVQGLLTEQEIQLIWGAPTSTGE